MQLVVAYKRLVHCIDQNRAEKAKYDLSLDRKNIWLWKELNLVFFVKFDIATKVFCCFYLIMIIEIKT